MSNIVAFNPDRLRRREKPATAPFQLLFFTGVRYVRQGENEDVAPKRRRLHRVRDRKKRSA